MSRNITAIYRTRPTADLVRRGLEEAGVPSRNIHVIPDRDDPVSSGQFRDNTEYSDRLHDLHLPEDDLRTYQQSVRRGDYVVSAEVDEDKLDRAKAVMRRPEQETYDMESRTAEFRDETIIPHTAGEGHMINEEARARRLAALDDPHSRTYERRSPLTGFGAADTVPDDQARTRGRS